MHILFDTALFGIILIFRTTIYFCLGIIKMFCATKQQIFTLLLLIAIVWVDAYIIYPDLEYWMHLIILIMPIAYLINIGRSY
ncbi:MAG: hypothetical protein ABF289_17780 [Clostridiales bacterium]